MWIFLSTAFLSIVDYRDNPDMLLVRSRARGDIESVFPSADVSECGSCDYRFRTVIPRQAVADAMREYVAGISYDNFKNAVANPERHQHYFDVWSTMRGLQDRYHE